MLNELADKIHANSQDKGFWPADPEAVRNPFEVLALVHSEVTEALEAMRDNKWDATVSWHSGPNTVGPEMKIENGRMLFKRVGLDFDVEWVEAQPNHLMAWGYVPKPEGVPSELADIIIRTLDAAAAWGIDIDEAVRLKVAYNETREILHGRAR
jgi:hypothetical protein